MVSAMPSPMAMTMAAAVADRKIEAARAVAIHIMRPSVSIRRRWGRRSVISRRNRRGAWRGTRRAVINGPIHIIVVAVMTCNR